MAPPKMVMVVGTGQVHNRMVEAVTSAGCIVVDTKKAKPSHKKFIKNKVSPKSQFKKHY